MKRGLAPTLETSDYGICPDGRAVPRGSQMIALAVTLVVLGGTALHAQTTAPANLQGSTPGAALTGTSGVTPGSTTSFNGSTSPISASTSTATSSTAGTAGTGSVTSESATGGSTNSTAVGSATGTTALSSSSSSVSAPASGDPNAALQLPGEAPNSSSNAAHTTASSAGGASAGASGGSICGPAVPSTDGGSVNITEVVPGISLNGC